MRFLLRLPRIAMPLLRLMALSILITVSGCFPVQLADEPPFQAESLAFIEIGKTTKEQVDAALSNFTVSTDQGEEVVVLTPRKFKGGDWWLYDRFVEALVIIGPYIEMDPYDRHVMLIKFDANEIVSEYDVFNNFDDVDQPFSPTGTGAGACGRGGVCWWGTNYMLLDSEDVDNFAKTFQRPDEKCAIYLYAKGRTDIDTVFPFEVKLDNEPVRQQLYTYFGFLNWRADNGQHQITVMHKRSRSPKLYPVTIDVDCEKGDILFVEYKANPMVLRRDRRNVLNLVEESDGRREINKRRLVLMD